MLLHLEEISVVDHRVNHVFDVIRLVRLLRNNCVQSDVCPITRIGTRLSRWVVQIVRRHEAQQLPHHRQAFGIVVRQKVGHAGRLVVRHGAAQLIFRDFFMGHGLDHVRPGDEHVGGLIDHEDEVRNGRRIHRTPRARSHNGGNLWHHSAIQRVAQENVGVAGQRHHAFLNSRAAGVVQPDYGRSHLGSEVHDLDDLRRVRFRK